MSQYPRPLQTMPTEQFRQWVEKNWPVWKKQDFDAGNFTGLDDITWTVAEADVLEQAYKIEGKYVTYNLQLGETDVGGTPSIALYVTTPFTAAHNSYGFGAVYFNGTSTALFVSMSSGTNYLNIYKDTFTVWANGTLDAMSILVVFARS